MPSFISIPNVLGNFYGGNPYAIDLQINFDGPSTLKISVFNESGNYGTPTPGYSAVQTVTIGSIQFVGFLVEYRLTTEADAQILELEYEDCSSILDRTFIGLHKRHGVNTSAGSTGVNSEYFIDTNAAGNPQVVIVGREILRLGEDFGGYSQTHIHDVGYYFNELLAKIGVASVAIPNVNYVKDYSGNLREVLSSWCSDYGLMYYWEFGASTLQSGLKFFDLKTIITISEGIINNCEATNKSLRVSARGTVASGEVAYYEREGGPINAGFGADIPFRLRNTHCLSLVDLFGAGSTVDHLQMGVCLARYSQSLRDLYYWHNYRQITDANKLDSVNNSELVEFGLSDVVLVCSRDVLNTSQFNTIKEFGSEGDTIGNKADKYSAINGLQYYFFIAKLNEEAYKSKLSWEFRVAEEFLGKHWLSSFDVTGKNPRASVTTAGDMNAVYIDHLAVLPSLPFANFGHIQSSYVGGLVQDGKSGGVSLTRSMIYGEKTGMWYPDPQHTESYEALLAYYDSIVYRSFDAAVDQLFSDLGLDTSTINQSNGYQLFMAFNKGPLPVTRTATNNFLDQNQMTPAFSGDENNTILGNVGLLNNRCYFITFDGFQIMAPCGALSFGENPPLGGTYVVAVENNAKNGSLTYTTKKTQYTNANIPSLNGVAKANINFNPVSGDDISQTRPITIPSSSQQADADRAITTGDVRSYAQAVLAGSAFVQQQNSRYIEFTLAGLPTKNANIRDGLDSLSIRVEEDGVFTQYAYSDKLIKAQEAMEIRKMKNAVTNYNHLPRRYLPMLENNAQNGFIQQP